MLQEYYSKASWFIKFLIKGGILYGALLLTIYVLFRASYINLTPALIVFSLILFTAELHTVLHLFGFFYSLWPRRYKTYDEPNTNRDLQVNMFITVCGEPAEVIADTIRHAKVAAEKYNKVVRPYSPARVIVLNDGFVAGKDNWKEIRDLCKEEGVNHVARTIPGGYKAGNINNALKVYAAKNPEKTIDCFFDSDFCAKEDFVLEILKPFNDKAVDFVQSPQRYKSYSTWVAKASSAHQIFFFDYICPAKAHDNALFLCGTNYAIKRKALLDVGGVDTNFITEDYATSINLHLAGKKGVFISKVLALGMAPLTLKEYFTQQQRWSKGSFDTNFKLFRKLFFGPLTLKQKFHYFLSATYYLIGLRDLILIFAPIPFLFWGVSLIKANTFLYLTMIYGPLFLYNTLLYGMLFRYPIKSIVLDIVSFPIFTVSFLSSILKKNLAFIVTIKKYEKENPFKVYRIQLMTALLLLVGLVYGIFMSGRQNSVGSFINYFWAIFDATFLLIGFFLIVRENISFKIAWSFDLPKVPNFVYGFSKVIAVFVISLITGFTAPIIYDVLGNEPQKLLAERYAHTTKAIVNYGKTEELVVPSNGVYYGYYLPKLNSHPENPEVSLLENETPSLAMYYQDWNPNSLFDKDFMNKLSNKGVVPVVTWEPSDATNLNSELNAKGAPQKLITEGKYDEYIRIWAKYAKDYNKPFFLRFAHEMNGNWYSWGNHEGPESYVAMWRHVHDIFEEEGANNVIWVWSPNNTNEYGVTEGVLEYYPGDEYVDWVAYSAFNWGSVNWKHALWRNFEYMSFDIYNELSKLNKPIMIAETSSVSAGGDKTGWLYRTLSTDIPKMDKVKAVILFSQNVGPADFALDYMLDLPDVIGDNITNNEYYLKNPIIHLR